jgi:hypothetical protein
MKRLLLIVLPLLLIVGCEDKKEEEYVDDIPPNILITFPQNNSTIFEMVTITCISSDNVGVEKVELWINGISTELTDDSEPYSFGLNTFNYEDGNYTITVRSYDVSQNMSDSDPIILTIDNTDSSPSSVVLNPIIYDNGSFELNWSQSIESDFYSYHVYESNDESMLDENLIYETTQISDTSYVLNDIPPGEKRYYKVIVKDTWGFESLSNIQDGISVIMFEKVFSGSSINEIQLTNEDGYVFLNMDGYSTKLIKVGQSGLVLWEKSIGDESLNLAGVDLINTSDDGFLVLVNSGDPAAGETVETHIYKVDSYGNQIWIKIYGGEGKIINKTSDGGFVVLGYNHLDEDLLFKIDDQGNEVWEVTFLYHDLNSFVETSDGSFMFVGYGSVFGRYELIKTNSTGVIEWGNEIGFNGKSISNTNDNGFIISGSLNDYEMVMKIDNNGTEIWRSDNFVSSPNTDIIQSNDGGYVSTGKGNNHVRLTKYDSSGNGLWSKYYGDSSPENRGLRVKQTPDNGFIILGKTINYDTILIKTDPFGFSSL